MALPKLNTATYELDLPSTGEKLKYRPWLVKEQKILMMAQEGEKQNEAGEEKSEPESPEVTCRGVGSCTSPCPSPSPQALSGLGIFLCA